MSNKVVLIKLNFFFKSYKKIFKYFLFIFFIILSELSWSDADSLCPDVVEYGGEDIQYWFYDRSTGEPYKDGQILPVGTWLNYDILATAYGKCEKIYYDFSAGACPSSGSVYVRNVNNAKTRVTISSDGLNGDFSSGNLFGKDPTTGTTAFYQELDSRDNDTSTGTMNEPLFRLGSYRFRINESINTTPCDITPSTQTRYITFFTHDFDHDKEVGCSRESETAHDGNAGNPCNVANGNKYQAEIDYVDALSNLTFIRHYNSHLALLNFGLGFGWTSPYHKRLELYSRGSLIRARRPDGHTEVFTLSGQTWQGDPENTLNLTEDGVGFTLRLKNDHEESYDLSGRIISETDLNGFTLTYSYDTDNHLANVQDIFGRTLEFGYNTNGFLTTVTTPSGRTINFSYDSELNLEQVYYAPENVSRTYHYDDPRTNGAYQHYLTGITDERGIRYAFFEYNDSNKVSASYHTGNVNRVDITYNSGGTRTLNNSRGYSTNYSTLKQNGITLVTDKSGAGCSTCGKNSNISNVFDPANNNLLIRIKDGVETEYGNYDANGNYGFKIEAKGTTEERRFDYTYDPQFHSKVSSIIEDSVATGLQKVTTYTYDNYGNVTDITIVGYKPDSSPVTITTSYQYNGPFKQLSQYNGPRTDVNDVTRLEYYPYTGPSGTDPNNGRLVRVIGPDAGNGSIILRNNIQYTSTGKVLSEDRPNGLQLSYSYYPGNDRIETLTESKSTLSHTSRWTYLPSGEVQTVTLGYGSADATTLTFAYDGARRLTRITDGLGNYIEYNLDTEGNTEVEKIYDNQGFLKKQITQTYDMYNRLGNFVQENQSRDYNFAANGELIDTIDGSSVITRYNYDALSRMVKATQDAGGTAQATVDTISEFTYDSQDNLTSVINPKGNVTQYVYDDQGNLLTQISPDTGTTTFTYDSSGNITRKLDANGNSIIYNYDALNRLLYVDAPGSEDDLSYAYDDCLNGKGLLCSVTSNEQIIQYEYDAFGNITLYQNVGYSYDNANRIKTITYPSGAIISYDYDAAGYIQQVSLDRGGQIQTLASNIRYAPFGPVSNFIYGNAHSNFLTYDLAYRPTNLGTDGIIFADTLQYDSNGNLISRNVNANSEAYSYDALNRLETATGLFGDRGYDYDKNGNRSQLLIDGTTVINYVVQSDSNRLVSETDWLYIEDANGNILSKLDFDGVGWFYTYNAHNQLTSVLQRSITERKGQNLIYGDTVVGTYSYNGLGQRTTKAVSNVLIQYRYGLSGELLSDQYGNNFREYFYLNGRLLALVQQQEKAGAPGPETILDDGDAGTSSTGTWVVDQDKQGDDYNGDHLYANGGTNSYYRWTPTLTSGTYDVYARWPNSNKNSSSVPYTIVHSGQTSVIHQDQTSNNAQWVLLGTYIFTGDTSEYVEVSDLNGKTMADAVRFVKNEPGILKAGLYYAHNDHIGTPLRLTDETGATAWTSVYTPFGLASVNEDVDGDGNSVILNHRFPGQYYDQESGLHYNYYRDYDPRTGRYIQSDPIGLEGGLNTYAYVGGNPLSYSDPLGLYQMCHRDLLLPIPAARHCYAKFDDGTTASFDPTGVNPDPDPNQPGTSCSAAKEPQKDGCIKNAMKECKAENYSFTSFNCCHCVEQALKECGASIPASDWPNWPINPGPQPNEPGYSPVPNYSPTLGD